MARVPLSPSLVLLGCLAGLGAAPVAPPRAGLRLWLRASDGVEEEAGRVIGWRDQSEAGHLARVPPGALPPVREAGAPALAFGHDRLLHLPEAVLPTSCRALTLVGVARVEHPGAVVLFGSRAGAVPLVQLDVDGDGQARFIVRDGASQTLASRTPAPLGGEAVYLGVLESGPDGTLTARVRVGPVVGPPASGALASPLLSAEQWIGGLRVGAQRYAFPGAIREILVYDRALSAAEQDALCQQLTEKHGLVSPALSPAARLDSFEVLNPAHAWPAPTAELQTEVCVVGGGSGGVAAALAAARHGAQVILVERQARLGGTGTNAQVSSWEPGPGCTLAAEIYERMARIPGGAGVAVSQPHQSSFPMGFYLVSEGVPYTATLRRQGVARPANVSYRPQAFDRVVREAFAETGRVTVLDRTTFFHAEVDGPRVTAVRVHGADGRTTRIRARVFIDCTGDVYLCRAAGCETMLGVDPRSRFGESLAPLEPGLQLNALSRCYSIRPRATPAPAAPPASPATPFPRCAWITGWRDGPRTINPMPMLPGRALIDLGYDECLRRTERQALAHWHWLQGHPEVAGYELAEIAPMLGIREGYRVVTQYVLRQADLEAGLPNQSHPDLIAVADHPCDVHGAGGLALPLKTAYGIPYRCLIPQGGWSNLLVACRGSGFSHIAASSCRLQRTMIQVGHAAGVAAAMAVAHDLRVDAIDVAALVAELNPRARYPVP